MENVRLADWIALYAAILSSCLAISRLINWLRSGPRLSVTVFSPSETDLQHCHSFLAIIANSGTVSTVVRKLEVSFRTSPWFWGREIGRAEFGERSSWKPSVKLVPTNTPNQFRPEPNILLPGTELRAPAKAISEYQNEEHWIRVRAFARDSRKAFTGWAAPSSREDKNEEPRHES